MASSSYLFEQQDRRNSFQLIFYYLNKLTEVLNQNTGVSQKNTDQLASNIMQTAEIFIRCNINC